MTSLCVYEQLALVVVVVPAPLSIVWSSSPLLISYIPCSQNNNNNNVNCAENDAIVLFFLFCKQHLLVGCCCCCWCKAFSLSLSLLVPILVEAIAKFRCCCCCCYNVELPSAAAVLLRSRRDGARMCAATTCPLLTGTLQLSLPGSSFSHLLLLASISLAPVVPFFAFLHF